MENEVSAGHVYLHLCMMYARHNLLPEVKLTFINSMQFFAITLIIKYLKQVRSPRANNLVKRAVC